MTKFDDAEVIDVEESEESMIIKIMPLDTQKFTTYECDTFEFRSNNITNWISLKKDGKEVACVHRVGVIKCVENE